MGGKGSGARPINEPTDANLRALDAIKSFIGERGYPPTMTELGDALHCTSSTAFKHCKRLVEMGLLELDGGARAMRVVT